MKALPHVGRLRGETVCCAGVTAAREWRRLYPIHFRRLRGDSKFSRWQWVEYDWVLPTDDRRAESRRVQEDTITLGTKMPERERAKFLDEIVVPSTEEAKARGQTLALLRPKATFFSWKPKTARRIEVERAAYVQAASQLSFLDEELRALEPCPYAFHFEYQTEDGKAHAATCDDWETAATFYRFERTLGAEGSLARLHKIFNEDYPRRGMAFAMGTHSRRPDQWLLVGVLRLDPVSQLALAV